VSFTYNAAAPSFVCEHATPIRSAITAANVGCSLTTPEGVTGKSARRQVEAVTHRKKSNVDIRAMEFDGIMRTTTRSIGMEKAACGSQDCQAAPRGRSAAC
jgi:hypothetical protein